jgi:A/G-specific adenine glycosylase
MPRKGLNHLVKEDPKKEAKIRTRLIRWGSSNFADFPWRTCRSRFHALIAEILLQRTRAEQVEPAFARFQREFPNSESLANGSLATLKSIMKPLGLHWRIPLVKRLGELLHSNYGGRVPRNHRLESLPGVGSYGAAAYLSFHCNERRAIIDSNVVRLYARLFGFTYDGETRRKPHVSAIAERMTPLRSFKQYNYALLDFTRTICRPVPRCSECVLSDLCTYYHTQIASTGTHARKAQQLKAVTNDVGQFGTIVMSQR